MCTGSHADSWSKSKQAGGFWLSITLKVEVEDDPTAIERNLVQKEKKKKRKRKE
jgi:hypothetical protein